MVESNQVDKVAFSQRKAALQAPIVVSEIADDCLYSGFFGRLDSARMKAITDRILKAIEQHRCTTVIIDLASIDIIDSLVASHLQRMGETLRLVGVRSIFCGVSPVVAQTMTGAGVTFEGFQVKRNLKAALALVLEPSP